MKKSQGYIAVTSAVIISILLMVMVFTVSYTGFLNRFAVLDTTSKEVSRFAAEACVAIARMEMALDIAYSGDETIAVGAYQCQILPIEEGVPNVTKIIKTKASVNNAVTNLEIEILAVDLVALSWQEVTTF